MSRQTRALALVVCGGRRPSWPRPSAARADVIKQTADAAADDDQLQQLRRSPRSSSRSSTRRSSTGTENAVLDSVTLNFSAHVKNQFSMTFINPATITESFKPADPSSTGPTITLFQPDGKTPLLTAQEPNTRPT